MNAAQEKLVFISHASADAKKARALCKALEDKGFGCWIAPRDIDAGGQYGEEIIRGIQKTGGLVLMLSAKSNASPHVRDEAERAKHYGKRVIPFRIEDITPSQGLEFYIATSQWIDAFGTHWNTGVAELSTAIEKLGGKSPEASALNEARPANRAPMWLAAACLLVVAAGIGIRMSTRRGPAGEIAERGSPAIEVTAPPESAVLDSIHLQVAATGLHPNTSELVPRYHALVVGINTYTDHGDLGWENLRTAANDAREIASTLNGDYGFDVKLLINEAATRANIMQELDTIATAYPGDAILIYFAGHGFYKHDVDQGYWIPADARRKTPDGRPAKQDWVWNATIQEMLSSTKSKHVLMIADSCFSGSLFRGAEDGEVTQKEAPWYRRAIKKNSRYLITSGGLEPVPDGGGGGHSVFARKILDVLRESPGVFSASDMGQLVRQQVNAQTGQRVRMGHIPVASHQGGEFVFLRSTQDLPEAPDAPDADDAPVIEVARIQEQITARAPSQSKLAAAEMFAAGATNAALEALEAINDPFAQALADKLRLQARQKRADGVQQLIAGLEQRVMDETAGQVMSDDLWGEGTGDPAGQADLRNAEAPIAEALGLSTIAPTPATNSTISTFSEKGTEDSEQARESKEPLDEAQHTLNEAGRVSENSLSDAQEQIDAAHTEAATIRDAAANEAIRQDAESSLSGQLTTGIEEAMKTGQDSVGTAVGTAVGQETARKILKKQGKMRAEPTPAPGTAPDNSP